MQSSWDLFFWAKLFTFFFSYMFFLVKTNNNILTGWKKLGLTLPTPKLRLLNITFDRVTYIVKKGFINIFPLFCVDLQPYICKRLAPFSQTDNMVVSLLKNNWCFSNYVAIFQTKVFYPELFRWYMLDVIFIFSREIQNKVW